LAIYRAARGEKGKGKREGGGGRRLGSTPEEREKGDGTIAINTSSSIRKYIFKLLVLPLPSKKRGKKRGKIGLTPALDFEGGRKKKGGDCESRVYSSYTFSYLGVKIPPPQGAIRKTQGKKKKKNRKKKGKRSIALLPGEKKRRKGRDITHNNNVVISKLARLVPNSKALPKEKKKKKGNG